MSKLPPLPERDPSKPAEQQGIFRKFDVRRTDGSSEPGGKHHGCEYFVLDIDHDPAARAALKAYADAVEATHPKLAADMRNRYALEFARAIESAATEPLLQRIAELEETNAQLREQNTEVDKACAELERRIEVGKNIVRNDMHRIGQVQARVTELERQLEESRKDAERYRWLVAQMMHPDADHQEEMFNRLHAINPDPANAKEVDAAIDAAMQKVQS